jgi:hypothetical protein
MNDTPSQGMRWGLNAGAILLALVLTTSVGAQGPVGKIKLAKVDKKASTSAPLVTTAKSTTKTKKTKKALPITVKLSVETSVGIGTFVGGEQQQVAVSTGITPSLSYSLAKNQSLSAAIGTSIYHINDYGTAFFNGTVLLGDLYVTYSHGKLYSNKKLGLSISGAFRVYLPTSLSSQYQNRIFSMRPSLSGSWKKGKFSIGFTTMFTKYFGRTTSPTIDCSNFEDGFCREGRPEGPGIGGGFESERKGGEVFLPSSGANSFYVGNSLSISYKPIPDLTLSMGLTIYNIFGICSFDVDTLSSPNAKAGRSQLDRVISSVSVSYKIMKQLSVGLGFTTDTVRPFGDDGKSQPVIFDTTRAPLNISSLSLSLTGTL